MTTGRNSEMNEKECRHPGEFRHPRNSREFRHEWHKVSRNLNKGKELGRKNGIYKFNVYIWNYNFVRDNALNCSPIDKY
jgi:hypothetical protein